MDNHGDAPYDRPASPQALGFQHLSEKDINDFFDDLDQNKDGLVAFDELEAKLEDVHDQIAPHPKEHHLHHPARSRLSGRKHDADPEKPPPQHGPEHDGLHAFLSSLMPDCGSEMNRETFVKHVRRWNVPSPSQASAEDEDKKDAEHELHLPLRRRLRAHWSVEGPQYLFFAFVVALQLAFGIWQGVKYIENPLARSALGWGVILAKFAAGALYPTLFFVFLSMSRWFSTFMRRFYHVSRFINWDHHQAFHIVMSCEAYVLAFLHAIGHLTGPQAVPKPYVNFVRTTPGWTGITAFGLFTIIFIFSMPAIRKKSYEAFQLAHLLMYPFGGLLCAHGTAALLQKPALGYVLAIPLLLVILERAHRILRGCISIPARMEMLDENTVSITCKHPRNKDWRYQPGQYIFLQVPSISYFQWHPFTISACKGKILQLHIKCENGGWTEKLRDLPLEQDVRVGIDGPFGAPAQRFYNFDRSIIMGAGIGVTPFSAILTDMEQRVSGNQEDPWRSGRKSRRSSVDSRFSRRSSRSRSRDQSTAPAPRPREASETKDAPAVDDLPPPTIAIETPAAPSTDSKPSTLVPKQTRRVDFIWSVRERNDLLWFSSLLNRVHDLAASTAPALTINVRPYITARRKGISTHVFRYLLDRYRTSSSPVSALTGLKMTSNFGRPDLEKMLEDFHADMLKEGFDGKVGVFFCGSPKIGRVLSDACEEMTARARADGSGVRYMFMMEVFG